MPGAFSAGGSRVMATSLRRRMGKDNRDEKYIRRLESEDEMGQKVNQSITSELNSIAYTQEE